MYFVTFSVNLGLEVVGDRLFNNVIVKYSFRSICVYFCRPNYGIEIPVHLVTRILKCPEVQINSNFLGVK